MKRAFVIAGLVVLVPRTDAQGQTPAQPGQPHRIIVLADGGSLRIQWEVNGNVEWTSYRLEFLSSPAGPVVAMVTVGPARDVTFGIPPGTQGAFWVTITGIGNGTESPPSMPVPFAIRETSCSGPPPAPIDLTATLTSRIATFNWRPSAGAAEYVLQAGRASGSSDLFDGSVGGQTGLSASVPAGLVAFVRVFAQNACGRSGASNEIVIRDETGHPTFQRWVGQTGQGHQISFEIDTAGVRSAQIRATTVSGRATAVGGNPQACIGEMVNFSWPYSPSSPIVNGQVTLSGVNPDGTVRFQLAAAFGVTSANGTLDVTIRKPGAFCEGSVSTNWTALRQQ